MSNLVSAAYKSLYVVLLCGGLLNESLSLCAASPASGDPAEQSLMSVYVIRKDGKVLDPPEPIMALNDLTEGYSDRDIRIKIAARTSRRAIAMSTFPSEWNSKVTVVELIDVTPENLDYLLAFPALTSITITLNKKAEVNGSVCRRFSSLTNVESLLLSGPYCSSDEMEIIGSSSYSKNLKALMLYFSFTELSLDNLSLPNLHSLSIMAYGVRLQNPADISRLISLVDVDIHVYDSNRFPRGMMLHLCDLSGVKRISMSAGLTTIAEVTCLEQLEYLGIPGNCIDASELLSNIDRLNKLKVLDITGNGINEENWKLLKQGLPNCIVYPLDPVALSRIPSTSIMN